MAQFDSQAANAMPPQIPSPLPVPAASAAPPPIGTTPPSVLARQAAEGSRGAAWRLLYLFMKNDPQAVMALTSFDDDRLARYILEFLAQQTWAGKPFVAPPSLYSPYARTRLRTLFLPGSGMDQARAERVLLFALHDKRPALRAHALHMLGLIGQRNTVPALLEALDDPVPTVRMQAVKALGRTGDPAAVPALLRLLHTADEVMGGQIFFALVQLGSAAVPPLIAESASPSAWMRWHCIRALGEICDDRAIPVLVHSLADSDHAVAWMAAKSLPGFGKLCIQPVLTLLMTTPMSAWLVETASYVLRELCQHHKETRPYLEPVLHSMQHITSRVATPAIASKALDQLRASGILTAVL